MSLPPGPEIVTRKWLELADEIRPIGGEAQAATFERCAQEILEWWRDRGLHKLKTEEAVEYSGFSRSALFKMRQKGVLENVGNNGASRYRAGELPRKAGRLRRRERVGDLADEAVRSRAEARGS